MKGYTFKECDINEMGRAQDFIDHIARPKFQYEQTVIKETNQQLLNNFFKCCDWVKENYPNLTYMFNTLHHPYHKLDVDVTDGDLTLCCGSHGASYSNFINKEGSAFYSQGSEQRQPYFFKGLYGFPNVRLAEFLSQWTDIKDRISSIGNTVSYIYSPNFVA